jgi:hypothetical protein
MNQLRESKTEQGRKLTAIQQNIEQAGDAIERAMAVAKGLRYCRDMVASQLAVFKDLAGSQMGFAVDRPDRTTDREYIEAISQALLEGASITGNHFAIISGRYYLQLPGWESRWSRIADTAPDVRLGTIEVTTEPGYNDKGKATPGIARVEAEGSVSVQGELYEVAYRDLRSTTGGLRLAGMDERLAIRINHGMGEDAVLGKARARILKALWRMRLGERPPAATEDDTPAGETVVSVAEPPAIAGPTQPVEPSKLDRWAMALDEATDQQSLLAASAAFEWTDADGADRQKARDMYAARKKAVGK